MNGIKNQRSAGIYILRKEVWNDLEGNQFHSSYKFYFILTVQLWNSEFKTTQCQGQIRIRSLDLDQ